MNKYIMALDAGTTSNRCILFNEKVKFAMSKFASLAQCRFLSML